MSFSGQVKKLEIAFLLAYTLSDDALLLFLLRKKKDNFWSTVSSWAYTLVFVHPQHATKTLAKEFV